MPKAVLLGRVQGVGGSAGCLYIALPTPRSCHNTPWFERDGLRGGGGGGGEIQDSRLLYLPVSIMQ